MFLENYFPPSMVTKLINEITNFCQCPDESLFEAWERYKLSIDRCPNHNMLPVTQIDTFYNGLTLRHRDTINVAAGGTFMKRLPEECYDLIENMTAHHNDWDTSAQCSESSSSITSSSDTEIAALKAEMAEINKNLMRVLQGANQGQNQPLAYQALVYQAPVHQPHIPQPQVVTTNEFTNFMKANDAILKNMQTNVTSLTNSNLELKNMFGQFMKMNTALSSGSGTLPSNTITNPKEDLKVERETEATKDTLHPTNNGSTEDVQPPVVLTESLILNYEPVNSPINEPVASPVSASKPNQRPSISYPSRLQDQKLRDKANDQREKFFQIFKDLNFNISFADALILMPKFGPSIKSLLTNKDKLCELARTPLNEHCLAVLLKKFPKKLGDPGKFLISCDFPRMAGCLALADLGASINLMPLSVWNKLSLHDLSPTCMTLELADRSISRPTSRYSANYNDITANRIDVIDMACEEYSQEVLSFSDVITRDILLLEAFLNDDPSLPPPNQGNYLPEVRKELKFMKLNLINLPLMNLPRWRVCIDYHKLNEATHKDHFPLPFMDQMLERLAGNQYYCFLDGFSSYFQIPIDPKDQEKTTFTCPYGTFAYRRMPFGLCNTPGTFQSFMMAIFHDMIKKTMEVFMDDFLVFRNSFQTCLSHLEKMLKRCKDTNLCLNWEKSHFMVKEGHVGFYRRFIQDFSKIARPMTHLFEKDTTFIFSKECVKAFQALKRKLTKAPILIAPDWDIPFELMCDASDFAIGAVLGQHQGKHFRPIHYACKTITEAESNYTITEKEMLAVVYAFEKFRSYLIMNKSIVYTDHSALKYLFAKKDSKARFLRWVLLLQEFTFKVIDTKGAENLAADHLS
nr:putative pol polyprotein [Tanacetum cinerariifolium]